LIDDDIRDIITPELTEGEELLWAGRPQKHPFLLFAIYAFGFALLWIGGVLFILFHSINAFFAPELGASTSIFMLLTMSALSCLFLLIGYLQLRYAIIHLFGIKKQVYALTSHRGLIVENYLKNRSLSLERSALSIVYKDTKKSLGTFIFGVPEVLKRKDKKRFSVMHPIRLAPIFYNIKNPNEVEALILRQFYLTESSS